MGSENKGICAPSIFLEMPEMMPANERKIVRFTTVKPNVHNNVKLLYLIIVSIVFVNNNLHGPFTFKLFSDGGSVMELQQTDQQQLLQAAPGIKQDVDIVDVGAAEAIVQLQQPPDMTTEVKYCDFVKQLYNSKVG